MKYNKVKPIADGYTYAAGRKELLAGELLTDKQLKFGGLWNKRFELFNQVEINRNDTYKIFQTRWEKIMEVNEKNEDK